MFTYLRFIDSVSPRRVMLIGILCQMVFGILTGMVRIYVAHTLFRCLSAFSCALMYTSGTMICEYKLNANNSKIENLLIFIVCLHSDRYHRWHGENYYHHSFRIVLVDWIDITPSILSIYTKSIWFVCRHINTDHFDGVSV